MHTVAVVLMDGVVEFDFSIPCEIFGTDRREIADPWYRLVVVGGRVRTQAGVIFEGTHDLKELGRADTIIVPGATTSAEPPQALLRALVRAHERGARIASVCIGAFVLAEAGLLDGRRATTHWAYAEELQRRYPLVEVDASVLYVDEGDVLTSPSSRRASTCASISSSSITERTQPPRSPGGSSCPCTGRAARRSTSRHRSRPRRATSWNGPRAAWATGSRWTISLAT